MDAVMTTRAWLLTLLAALVLTVSIGRLLLLAFSGVAR